MQARLGCQRLNEPTKNKVVSAAGGGAAPSTRHRGAPAVLSASALPKSWKGEWRWRWERFHANPADRTLVHAAGQASKQRGSNRLATRACFQWARDRRALGSPRIQKRGGGQPAIEAWNRRA